VTTVAEGIAAALVRRGLSVGVMKPVAVGCPLSADLEGTVELAGLPGEHDAQTLASLSRLAELAGPAPAALTGPTPSRALQAVEARRLMAAAGLDAGAASIDQVNPYRFAPDIEPAAAARAADQAIDPELLSTHLASLMQQHDVVLVDGGAGLMVPLNDHTLMVDVLQRWEMAVLLVAPSRPWAAINSTLLSAELLRSRGVPLSGVVLDRLRSELQPEEAVNSYQLEQHKVVVRGLVPWLEPAQREDLDHLARRVVVHLDLDGILQTIGLPHQ